MILEKEHIEFEKFCRQLVGKTTLKVEYSEIVHDSKNQKPYYETKKKLDTVDFSIYFQTDQNELIEIDWD